MNKRRKKKLYKQTLIKVKKLYPQRGDVICLQPNLDCIDLDTMCNFLQLYENCKAFGEANIAIVPANIKKLEHKEKAQMYIDKLQSIVDQMRE